MGGSGNWGKVWSLHFWNAATMGMVSKNDYSKHLKTMIISYYHFSSFHASNLFVIHDKKKSFYSIQTTEISTPKNLENLDPRVFLIDCNVFRFFWNHPGLFKSPSINFFRLNGCVLFLLTPLQQNYTWNGSWIFPQLWQTKTIKDGTKPPCLFFPPEYFFWNPGIIKLPIF